MSRKNACLQWQDVCKVLARQVWGCEFITRIHVKKLGKVRCHLQMWRYVKSWGVLAYIANLVCCRLERDFASKHCGDWWIDSVKKSNQSSEPEFTLRIHIGWKAGTVFTVLSFDLYMCVTACTCMYYTCTPKNKCNKKFKRNDKHVRI